ncbi:glycine dehydrogenase, partial [bacterium]
HYRQVLDTYCWSMGIEVVTLEAQEGETRTFDAAKDSACVIVGYPNFFGIIEDLGAARAAADANGALLIVVADPVACALLKAPGAFGADIVVGEGQPMGVPMGLGGPLVGLFACKKEFVRAIPGRIVGKTTELASDRGGYVMTLRTREQDIRREKATSNICTNEALMALACTVYMATLGKNGMRQVADSSVRNAQYALGKLTEAGAKRAFPGRIFDEFVLDLGTDATIVRDALLGKGILAGLPLGAYDPAQANLLLVAVTETRTKDQIDAFAAELKSALSR